jgi:hypothetical protein
MCWRLRLACRPSAEYSFSSAFSRMLHVLYTSTSACPGSSTQLYPSDSSDPAMRSLSALFIWQPKVMMWYLRPLGLAGAGRDITVPAGAGQEAQHGKRSAPEGLLT